MNLELSAISGPKARSLGKKYFKEGRVASLTRSVHPSGGGLILQGVVQGRKRYECTIQLSGEGEDLALVDAECTCPAQTDCEHIVATLEAWASAGEQESDLSDQATAGWDDDPSFQAWLQETAKLATPEQELRDASGAPKAGAETISYFLVGESLERSFVRGVRGLKITAQRARIKQDGKPGKPTAASLEAMASEWDRPRYASAEDGAIAQLVLTAEQQPGQLRLLTSALERAVTSGRLHHQDEQTGKAVSICLFEPEHAAEGTFSWHVEDDGRQVLELQVDGAPATTTPAFYGGGVLWCLEREQGRLTRVEIAESSPALLHQLLRMPPVSPNTAKQWRNGGLPAHLTKAVPAPALMGINTTPQQLRPTPLLRLRGHRKRGAYDSEIQVTAEAELFLRYGSREIDLADTERTLRTFANGEVTMVERDPAFEETLIQTLEDFELLSPWSGTKPGLFVPAFEIRGSGQRDVPRRATQRSDVGQKVTSTADFWFAFAENIVPRLQHSGWEVEVESSFPFVIVDATEWVIDLDERRGDWLGVKLGIQVGDERMPAAPLLANWLRSHGERALHILEEKRVAKEEILLASDDGTHVRIAAERVWRMVSHLLGYFDQETKAALKLTRVQTATLLADLEHTDDVEVEPGDRLRDTISGLKRLAATPSTGSNTPSNTPKGLKASLRQYQQEGVDWLQTLHGANLGGILADDMGLGKTVQLLSHLLLLKEQGKLEKPALVVAPTSVLGEWAREAARFTPGLSILQYTGPNRAELNDALVKTNVVLTSYALLHRDAYLHHKQTYSVVALDEAQYVKNDQAATTRAAGALTAEQRICLTGTPLENHLGELWSLMAFAAPSALGTKTWFRSVFRTPIEKQDNQERLVHLKRRVSPFILRRNKELVAKELPPKTEILRHSELSLAQRDIYETVRATMEKRVRDEIAKIGLARSQIVVLDALLKLRQVCCHPGLLKWHKPTDNIESGKFEDFKNLLTSLLQEGRRVLVFSQFVKMLTKIEAWLKKEEISYAKLTGSTKDRPKQIKRFTNKEVPVFLISLKAGGTGLNLTEADTVIHYDPWWNPAVEAQATDRAHRIGQDKKVFVYRMITKGTVEETIVALHEKKKGLSDAILQGTHERLKLSENDIDSLFAPLG